MWPMHHCPHFFPHLLGSLVGGKGEQGALILWLFVFRFSKIPGDSNSTTLTHSRVRSY
jgi:hypothetical protein